jgi:diguanylate cyclase (GGDEF)-like protein
MLKTNPSILHLALKQLEQATVDHAVWRDHLLRVIARRLPGDPDDLASDAHRRCLFGQWYFQWSLPELRELPSFAMIGAEHENQHRIAATLLRSVLAGVPVGQASVEEFEEASARLNFAMYFVKREIESVLQSRDAQTDAHSSGHMMQDLREWHTLAKQPGRQCCLALMQLDDVQELNAAHGDSVVGKALVTAVKIIATHLRPSDKVFRYDAGKFLIRLSGTDLASGKTVITRLREAVSRGLTSVGAEGIAFPMTASFGISMLDPEVDALESIDRADQALMLAKALGHNRMITWDPSVTTGVRLRRLEVKDVDG